MNKHSKKNDIDKFNATLEQASIATQAALICRVAPVIYANLLHWMADRVRPAEKVEVAWWEGPRFYISVKDTRNLPEYHSPNGAARYRIGLTVDMDEDRLILNRKGGNCFVRDPRWKAMFAKRWPEHMHDIHVYAPHRLPKNSGSYCNFSLGA